MSAEQVLAVAETPQFLPTTTQQALAASVLTPNMDDWQRPLDAARVAQIAAVFRGNELMPNPVLLSQNGNLSSNPISIRQQLASNHTPTNIWEIEIEASTAGSKPLWILDGQHRIHGLYQSVTQAKNEIPVVLLLNDHHVYTGSILAKIFAQVTTGAKKLDELHHEWLTYAFRLGDYDPATAGSGVHRNAMQAVAELCSKPQFAANNAIIPNIFVNNIRFNEQNPLGPFPFGYDCTDLKALVYKHYYNKTSQGAHIAPLVLASEVCRAVQALYAEVQAPQPNSVFLGDADHAQRLMKDAFLVGVLSRLLIAPPPIDWQGLLQALQFSHTSWNFSSWTRSLTANKNVSSRNVAYRVFTSAFQNGKLPGSNLADFLRGNNASVDLVCSVPTHTGRGSTKGAITVHVPRSATLSPSVQEMRHLVSRRQTENIASIKVVDGNSPPGRPKYYPELLGQGMKLDPDKHSNPLKLDIIMEFYGGVEVNSELLISWAQ